MSETRKPADLENNPPSPFSSPLPLPLSRPEFPSVSGKCWIWLSGSWEPRVLRTAGRWSSVFPWLEAALRPHITAGLVAKGEQHSFLWLSQPPPPLLCTQQSALLLGDPFLNLPIMFKHVSISGKFRFTRLCPMGQRV